MNISSFLREKASQAPARIILPEGFDKRVQEAAVLTKQLKVCEPVLLLNKTESRERAVKESGVRIIEPEEKNLKIQCANKWDDIKKTGPEQASMLMNNRLNLAVAMLYLGMADGMVAGADHSTADVLKPALELRRLYPGAPPVTSCFIMQIDNQNFGSDGIFIFADCGMNPDPSAPMLAQIAGSAGRVAKDILEIEPKIAMLSFSTNQSAPGPFAEKVRKAVEIAKSKFPEFKIDGEMQADAAIVDWIGGKKFPGSPVAGKANVLIFPDLNSGNIAYKLVERLAKAKAIGPVISGLNPPVNDLSRGCSVDDIIDMCAVTSLQVASAKKVG